MAPRTERERWFGAACVRVTLERAGHDPMSMSLYRDTLADLRVEDDDVVAYLQAHRGEVEAKLDAHRRGARGRG